VEQAFRGKGEERHGKGLSFDQQPWVSLAKRHGPGGLEFQAEKKFREAVDNINDGSWIAGEGKYTKEMVGAMVYMIMAVMLRSFEAFQVEGK
jgi:hypothetical protein